jgi:hypothetical protein
MAEEERRLAYEVSGAGPTGEGEVRVGRSSGGIDDTLNAINAALAAEGVDTTGLDPQPPEADPPDPDTNRIVFGLGSKSVHPRVGP